MPTVYFQLFCYNPKNARKYTIYKQNKWKWFNDNYAVTFKILRYSYIRYNKYRHSCLMYPSECIYGVAVGCVSFLTSIITASGKHLKSTLIKKLINLNLNCVSSMCAICKCVTRKNNLTPKHCYNTDYCSQWKQGSKLIIAYLYDKTKDYRKIIILTVASFDPNPQFLWISNNKRNDSPWGEKGYAVTNALVWQISVK